MSLDACLVIYDNPRDFPGKYVVRKHVIEPGFTAPTREHSVHNTLKEARRSLPNAGRHMLRVPRSPDDEPQIVEVWF